MSYTTPVSPGARGAAILTALCIAKDFDAMPKSLSPTIEVLHDDDPPRDSASNPLASRLGSGRSAECRTFGEVPTEKKSRQRFTGELAENRTGQVDWTDFMEDCYYRLPHIERRSSAEHIGGHACVWMRDIDNVYQNGITILNILGRYFLNFSIFQYPT